MFQVARESIVNPGRQAFEICKIPIKIINLNLDNWQFEEKNFSISLKNMAILTFMPNYESIGPEIYK